MYKMYLYKCLIVISFFIIKNNINHLIFYEVMH